jgi:hypothetical protein
LGIPAAIKFPYYDAVTETQKFPFKTLCMLCALITHFLVSTAARLLFEWRYLEADRWDFLNAFPYLSNNRTDIALDILSDDMSVSDTHTKNGKFGIVNMAVVKDSTDDVKTVRYNDPAAK